MLIVVNHGNGGVPQASHRDNLSWSTVKPTRTIRIRSGQKAQGEYNRRLYRSGSIGPCSAGSSSCHWPVRRDHLMRNEAPSLFS